jgi:hypothetical protein
MKLAASVEFASFVEAYNLKAPQTSFSTVRLVVPRRARALSLGLSQTNDGYVQSPGGASVETTAHWA